MGAFPPLHSADLDAHQPSVSRAVLAARVGGLTAGLGGVALAVVAWSTASVTWLVIYLAYTVVQFVGVSVMSAIPRQRQKLLDLEWARRFHELAHQDDLTGLYNRRYFHQLLDVLITGCRESSQPLTVALIDLNDFKSINDTFGHQSGDLALQAVAACISQAIEPGAIAARTGGDEFAVIFPGLGPAEAEQQVSAIRDALAAARLMLPGASGSPPRLHAAVGISSLDEFGEAERLLHYADSALYANKRELARLHDRRMAS